MMQPIFQTLSRFVQTNPYLWKCAWETIHHLPFLLPHDKSYLALRHFIALKPNGSFVDVGANDGISALSFRRLSKDYHILSLEPNQLLESSLKTLKHKDNQFDYRMIGAGSKAAHIQFLVPIYNGIKLHTFTSNRNDQIITAITDAFGQRVANKVKLHEVSAEVVPLDTLELAPSIIKIDAEGFDYDVLLGAETTIQQSRPFLMVEIAWTDRSNILGFLAKHNYTTAIYNIADDTFDTNLHHLSPNETGQRNIFAIPTELSGHIQNLAAL